MNIVTSKQCSIFNWSKFTYINDKKYLILQNAPQNTYFTTPQLSTS